MKAGLPFFSNSRVPAHEMTPPTVKAGLHLSDQA